MSEAEVTNKHYILDGVKYTRVSTLLDLVFAKEDSRAILAKMKPENRKAKYGDLTDDEILARWEAIGDEAKTAGTNLHNELEMYICGAGNTIENERFKDVLLLMDTEVTPCGAEQTLYYTHGDLKVAGTFDVMFKRKQSKDGEVHLILGDWKYSKKITSKGFFYNAKKDSLAWKFGFKNSDFHRYSLQLNFYAFMYEQSYPDSRIQELWLICLHPDHQDSTVMFVQKLPRETMIKLFDELALKLQVYFCSSI
jgi:hypothetical protein